MHWTSDGRQPATQQAACQAQSTAGGCAVATRPGRSCQVAHQAESPQRASLRVIAQTQWQLQSVRPGPHAFSKVDTGCLHSARAQGPAAAHAGLQPCTHFMSMARKDASKKANKPLPAKTALKQQQSAKTEPVLLGLRLAAAQHPRQAPSAAIKLPDQSGTAKCAQNCALRGHAGMAQRVATQPIMEQPLVKTEPCSVSPSFVRGLPVLACSCGGVPTAITSCTTGTGLDAPRLVASVPETRSHIWTTSQTSGLTGRRILAPYAAHVGACGRSC